MAGTPTAIRSTPPSGEISAANPEIVKAYAGFSHANAKSTHIDAKTRELIALAVAVTLRCDGCINAHTDAAIKTGASKEEIVDALGVAIMVNAGEVALRRRVEVWTKSGRPCSIQSLKRFVDPRDIAALCVFLASDAGKSISGQVIPIDNDALKAS